MVEYLAGNRITGLSNIITSIQGNNGGSGRHVSGQIAGAGGGGGHSSAGSNGGVNTSGGNGGNGTANSITGSSVTYSTGGGGGSAHSAGVGGSSNANNNTGSGSGGATGTVTANTGSGAGGGNNGNIGSAGSAGIVVIRGLTSELSGNYSQVGGTVDTSTVPGQTIIKWTTTSGTKTFSPTSSFNVQYLVVGGGGSAGCGNEPNGAGGSGGYLSSSSYAVTPNTYTITVGAGGAQPTSSANELGNNGSNSRFDDFIAIGGGAGGSRGDTASANVGKDGASGGGGGTKDDGSTSTTISGGSATTQTIDNKPTNIIDGSIFYGSDVNKEYLRTPEGADVNTTQISEQDNAGIDGDPNGGGWGAQFLAGHALVGKEIRSIKVKTKFSNASGNSVSMTARVYGSTKATLRATSTAISSSTLSQSYQDVTFVFPEGSRATLQAGDHIMIVTETAIMSSGSWLTPVKSTVGTNTHFTSWQGMDVNFYEQDASNGNRELYYNPIVSVTPATWSEV